MDWRFPIMALLAAVAALRPEFSSARAGIVAAAALTLLGTARTAWIGSIWQDRQVDIAAVERVLAALPAGAILLPAERIRPEGEDASNDHMLANGLPWHLHLAALAVPLRHAFVPTLFTIPGKQPLRVQPPWSEIAVLEGPPATVAYLREFVPTPTRTYMWG